MMPAIHPPWRPSARRSPKMLSPSSVMISMRYGSVPSVGKLTSTLLNALATADGKFGSKMSARYPMKQREQPPVGLVSSPFHTFLNNKLLNPKLAVPVKLNKGVSGNLTFRPPTPARSVHGSE